MGAVDSGNDSRAGGRKLLGESVFLYLASYTAIFLRFVGGFAIAGLLGPVLYGLRTIFGLITRYEVFSHAGTFDAMRKEVSYYRGRNDSARAELVMDNVYAANALYAVAAAIILTAAALYMANAAYPQIYVDFAIFLAAHIALDKLRTFYSVRIIADKRSLVLGKSRVLYELLAAGLGILFVIFWELRGLFVGLLAADLAAVAYLMHAIRRVPRLRVSSAVLLPLLRVGLPIMLTGLGFLMLKSVDQIVVATMLSTEMLGYFGFAVVVSGLIYMALADVMGAIYFPRLMERAGAAESIAELKTYLTGPTVLVTYFVPFIVGIAYLGVHLPVAYLLPEFVPAIQVCKILILGSFFYCSAIMPLMVCVAINKQMEMLWLTLAAVVLNAVFSYGLIRAGMDIDGVAIGTAVAHFVFSSWTISYLLARFEAGRVERLAFLAKIYAPFLYSVTLLVVLEGVSMPEVSAFWTDVALTAVRMAVFVLLFALILVPVRKDEAFQQLFRSLPIALRRASAESS